MAVRIRPLTSTVGAELDGVDLSAPLDEATIAEIRQAWLTHGVVFFRGQQLDAATQRRFGGYFASLRLYPFAPRPDDEVPEVHEIALDGADAVGAGADSWHTDATFMAEPPIGSVLRANELPPLGGDTCFASMEAAYEALSAPVRAMLDELTATHDYTKAFRHVARNPEGAAQLEARRKDFPPVHHPVVRTHPETGRKSLFVNRNFTTRLDGLTDRENDRLLPFLCDHVQSPDFQCRFRWDSGSVAFWDNRSVQHYAVPDYTGHRSMHRVILDGEPVA